MEPFEENCPIPSAHEKCTEARYFLIQCLLNYHSPQPFLHNLNAFIQAFRNITFMLQSENYRPGTFQAWYEVKREEMRRLPTLRRLVDARNVVVKKERSYFKEHRGVWSLQGAKDEALETKMDIKP